MKILHLEDNPTDAELVRLLITDEWPDCQITCVSTRLEYVSELGRGRFDLILSDFGLTSLNGIEALKLAKDQVPDTPFIFLSGTIGEDRAIEALRSGAEDYVLKDRMKRLNAAIARALRESSERRKHREAESRVRELAEFLNQAREAVIVTDLEGRITFWNQGAERLSGWSPAEALEKNCEEFFGPPFAAQLHSACHAALSAGEWTGELELPHRSGQPRLIELRISLMRDDAGRPRARLALGTDITERRQAERRIREQAQMLNQAREAIFITDLDHRIISWSAGAERLYGWKSEEVMGQTPEQLFDPQVQPALKAARDAAFAKGQWLGELRVHNRARVPLFVESRQTLIRDEANRPKARLSIDSDITDRKQLEEQFLRAQRMENIGLLAAGIAHDLNNMLAPILLAAPMLREHVSDMGALSLLTTLERSAERGANLVRQILAFAHGATGEHRLLQVKHLLRDISSVIAGTFPKSITLEDFIPGDLWPVNGNATQIHQVLLNLSVNARDAMPDGGTLRLRAENCTLDETAAGAIQGGRAGAYLVLHVEDSGTGIPPEVLKQMWQPFYTTKESGKGTGLGLSTVRGIVENHNGFIDLRTEVGRGTAFRIYLPAAENVTADRAPVPLRPPSRGKGELILVVDDERHIREMTSTMLARNGYRVLLAADGSEAAMVFAERATEIRLVITDLHMPNLDGATFARALRRIHSSAKLLVVSGLSTAMGDQPDYKPHEFADGFLHKPFRPEALLAKVQEVLTTGATSGTGKSLPPFATS
ncbi:MAG TPA: PAS domain S-box protein [Opitutaceae bacterium]|nr:PAS domain S-box protein [Opitutaceae bacterium]